MLYQSMSGDAADAAAAEVSTLALTDVSLTCTRQAPAVYVTNTSSQVTLTRCELTAPGGLATADEDRWGASGSNGGTLALTMDATSSEGAITAGSSSTITVTSADGGAGAGGQDRRRARAYALGHRLREVAAGGERRCEHPDAGVPGPRRVDDRTQVDRGHVRHLVGRGPHGAVRAERHEHAGGAPVAQLRRRGRGRRGRSGRRGVQDEPALGLVDDQDVYVGQGPR